MISGRVSERVGGKISVTIKKGIKGRFVHMITSSIGFCNVMESDNHMISHMTSHVDRDNPILYHNSSRG